MARAKKNAAGTAVVAVSQPQAVRPKRSKAPAHMYCACLADPAGSPACRIPDQYVAPTVAQKLVQEFTIDAGTGGNFLRIVSPSLARATYTHAVDATGLIGAQSNEPHPDYAATTGSFSFGRLVTYQVDVTYIGNLQTAAGRIALVCDSHFGVYPNGSNISAMFDDDFSGPAVAGGFMRIRAIEASRMTALTDPGFGVPSFGIVYIGGTGVPAGTNICVRVTKHLEFIPQRATMWRGVAQIEPYHPDVMTSAANMGPAGTVGNISQKAAKTSIALQAAEAAWNYVKSDVKEVGGFLAAGAYQAAKEPLLALMAA